MQSQRQILDQLARGEITKQQAKNHLTWVRRAAASKPGRDPIAVIGVAGRYPMAETPDALADLLAEGRSAITPIPPERWAHQSYVDADRSCRGKTPATHGGFLDGIDQFDPLLFKIAPRDAETMDPQDRIFLQVAWSAFEDAGYPIARLSGIRSAGARVGAFVGVCFQQYHHYCPDDQTKADGMIASFGGLAGRVSHVFDLTGPSIAVDTACSSSLMALHQAVNALMRNECQMALVGGVNLTEHPLKLVGLKHLLGSGDRSRPFGDSDGYLSSEGVGAVILKPLSAALDDRDHIHAIIRGVAIGHAGRGKGYCTPNSEQQHQVLRDCLADAGIGPEAVDYVEAAAMGSQQADAAEFAALARLFPDGLGRRVALGTVKSNIGHCEAASTMAQLTKVLLQFRDDTLFPTVNSLPLNPQVDFSQSALTLQTARARWGRPGAIALISSIGATGATGAIVVQGHAGNKEPRNQDGPDGEEFIPLSAAKESLLPAYAAVLADHIRRHPELRLRDIAHTLQAGRNHLKHRLVIRADSTRHFLDSLEILADHGLPPGNDGCWSGQAGTGPSTVAALASRNAAELATAWCGGAEIDWPVAACAQDRRHVPLPGYVFEKRRCWVQDRPAAIAAARQEVEFVVIGAGPAGLTTAKCLRDEGFEAIVLERSEHIGGIWAYRDNYASGPYKATRTQNSKHTFFFSDFPPEDDDPLFCDVETVQAYLQRYVNHFGLRDGIRLNCDVLQVAEDGDRWQVTYHSPDQGIVTLSAAGVVCCTGDFWQPSFPDLPGRASFKGLQISASAYHSNEIFTGKKVVVVGAGVSGADIVSDAVENAARCVWGVREMGWFLPRMVGFVPNDCSLSYVRRRVNREKGLGEFTENLRRVLPGYMECYERSGLIPTGRNNNIIHISDHIIEHVAEGRVTVRPAAVRVDEHGVYFADGSYEPAEVIVYCTGYKRPSYDYLRPIRLDDFAMSLFYRRNPSLCICNHVPGAAGFGAALPYFELVARWYAGLRSGRYRLTPEQLQAPPGGETRADGGIFFDGWTESLKTAHAIGVLPDPRTEWARYWQFVSMPPIPALFRLSGPLSWDGAESYIAKVRRKFFLKADDGDAAEIKTAILSGLGRETVDRLRAAAAITEAERSAALAHRGRRLTAWLTPMAEPVESPVQPSVAL